MEPARNPFVILAESQGIPSAPTRPVLAPSKDAKQDLAAKAASIRPTHDQIYLAGKLNSLWTGKGKLSPGAICRLNKIHGVDDVTSALRVVRGWPPANPGTSLYAYVVAALDGDDA